jgi:HAD superfamily hydrolase (TIGR01509 family)
MPNRKVYLPQKLIKGFKLENRSWGLMTVKAVVFDLDGTLAIFNINYRAVRADVRSFLIRIGIPASVLSVNESIFEMLKKTEIFMKNNGKSEEDFMDVHAKVLAIAEKYELEAAKTTSLLPGVLETLKILKQKNLKIGLCTVSSGKSANYILKRFGVAEYFDAVVPREAVKYVKPHPEHLEATLKALGVKPQEALVVGDGVGDVKCARELKAIAAGLTTGISTPKELINAGADYIITSVTDVPNLIQQINEASGI